MKKIGLSNAEVVGNRKRATRAKDGLNVLFGKITSFGGFGEKKPTFCAHCKQQTYGAEYREGKWFCKGGCYEKYQANSEGG
jgi:hypothetical protein